MPMPPASRRLAALLECAFRDAPGQPQHRDMGMYGVVEVQ